MTDERYKQGNLRVATFNANSIRMRLLQILEWLPAHAVDLLCVQETKVQDKDFPQGMIEEAGYQVVFKGQKAHAGVAIITKEPLEDVSWAFDDGEAEEPRLLMGSYHGVRIINSYVPQGRDIASEHFQHKLRWLERMRALLDRAHSPDELLLWTGDLNVAPTDIDVYDPKGLKDHVDVHPDARAALEHVCAWGLVDVVRKHHPEAGFYTYWDYRARNPIPRGVGWRIDHVLTTEPLAAQCTNAWVDVEARQADKPSDHTFLVADFDI